METGAISTESPAMVVANSAGKGAAKQDAAEEAAHHGSDGRTASAKSAYWFERRRGVHLRRGGGKRTSRTAARTRWPASIRVLIWTVPIAVVVLVAAIVLITVTAIIRGTGRSCPDRRSPVSSAAPTRIVTARPTRHRTTWATRYRAARYGMCWTRASRRAIAASHSAVDATSMNGAAMEAATVEPSTAAAASATPASECVI